MSSSYTGFRLQVNWQSKFSTQHGRVIGSCSNYYLEPGEDSHHVFSKPDSRVHAVAEFGNDLVSVVEEFPKVNWIIATKTVVFKFLFGRYRRRATSSISSTRNQPGE